MIVGIGIDVVDIDRMKTAVQRTPGIVNKILTQQELDQIKTYSNDQFVSSLAARFAAKEAIVKSLGKSLFEIGLKNISIKKDEITGAPSIEILDAKKREIPGTNDISFLCSLTHSEKSAAAVVVAQSNPK